MKGKDPHRVFNELLPRYLAGELKGEELALFREALEQDASLKHSLEEYGKLWKVSAKMDHSVEFNLDAEWGQMKAMLGGYGTEARGTGKRSVLFFVSRVAAVLVIGLLVGAGVFYTQRYLQTTTIAAGPEADSFVLDDGTKVLLNRDSRLRYRSAFGGSHRWVKLSGEAWFEVARDSLRPFVIEAGDAMVEVLGTSFNVNAYRENSLVEITVESGVVAVSSKVNRENLIVLRAGNGGSYDPGNKELKLIQESNPNTMSWRTHELYFDNTPLEEVAALIRKVYDVEIEFSNGNLAACPLTSTFVGQDLESVLRVLALTLDLEIERDDRYILLRGEACTE